MLVLSGKDDMSYSYAQNESGGSLDAAIVIITVAQRSLMVTTITKHARKNLLSVISSRGSDFACRYSRVPPS